VLPAERMKNENEEEMTYLLLLATLMSLHQHHIATKYIMKYIKKVNEYEMPCSGDERNLYLQ
jgi:hypothetical protein